MRSKLGRKSLFPTLALLVAGLYSGTASAQTHKSYILCQTKTSDAYEWYFSAIFMEGPEVSYSTLTVAFGNYVKRNYRKEGHAIGPADCFIERTREDVEDKHALWKRAAESDGNTIVETGWKYSD